MAFDVITPVRLGSGAIGVALTTLRTNPALTRDIVKDIDIANTTSGSITVRVYLVESGGAAGTSNQLTPTLTIPANGYYQWTGCQILHEGDEIQAIASAVGLTAHVSGGEAV